MFNVECLMTELIKYFESLEARIAALEAEVAELKNRPLHEPQVIEKEVIKEVPVEVVKEVVVQPSVVSVQQSAVSEVKPASEEPAPAVAEPKPAVEPEPVKVEPVEEPKPEVKEEKEVKEEVASPKAAIYGKPVDDIRLAISLGDRFLYQRELFGQNAELMQKTLTELNALGSFDEAVRYISKFGWDTESSTYQQFIVTLHRRFG